MMPGAVMRVRADGFAEICAWCSDKADADRWAETLGYRPSHGICEACQPKLGTDVIFEAGERCVAPDHSAARGTATATPSRLVVFSCRMGRGKR